MGKHLLISMALLMAAFVSAEAATEANFNVATYNIRQKNEWDAGNGNGWERREPHVAALVRFHDFDIFGTQEGFKSQLDDIKRDLPGFDYIGVGREDGREEGEYSAIFFDTSKFEILDEGNFWLSETPDKPGKGWDAACVRICTWGRFRHKPSGKEFMFYNLHMDHIGTTARIESAKLVKQRVAATAQIPTFVTGDFNVDQTSPAYATMTECGEFLDSHEVAGFVYQNNGTFNDYKTDGFTTSRIDHIFVTPDIDILKYGVLTDTYRTASPSAAEAASDEDNIITSVARTPSDHFPVKAVVRL